MKQLYTFLLLIYLPLAVFSQEIEPPKPKKVISTKSRGTLPALIRGPYLQVATTNSMVVRWRTDALSRSRVRYGATAENLNLTVDDTKLKTEHIIKLTGLSPNTKYYYSIGSLQDTLQRGADNFFVTLPPAGEEGKYKIGIFGDCGQNSVLHRTVRDQFIKYLGNNTLTSWMLLGDNAYPDGEDAQYQTNFFNIHKDNLLKKYPLFPVPGNHDYHDIEFSNAVAQKTHEVAYYNNFSMPVDGEAGGVASKNQAYYSYDVGNIHFLALDSYGMEENKYRLSDTLGPQVQWVKKDLAENKNKGWVVAYWHHPPYTMGSHNSDTETELVKIRENFIQILERAGVDLIICGHSHNYERSRLMMGHYGMEPTFNASKYNLSQSSGKYDGSSNSAPYLKDDKNDKGIVYVMSGSAASVGRMKPSFPHDAMPFANSTIGGSAILEVEGNRLDFKWICADGVIRDQFTMMKNVNKRTKIKAKRGEPLTLQASFPGKNYKWSTGTGKTRSIQIVPTSGTKTYTVTDEFNNLKDTFEVKAVR
jgi:acid phosphatase type 7